MISLKITSTVTTMDCDGPFTQPIAIRTSTTKFVIRINDNLFINRVDDYFVYEFLYGLGESAYRYNV